jgi:ABC-type amino acid transport substrate-binding protein
MAHLTTEVIMKKLIIASLVLVAGLSYGQVLKVGYVNSAPFAYSLDNDEIVVGSDVNLIRSANPKKVLDFVEYSSSTEMIKAFETEGLDYGIGGVSITPERNDSVIFSMPTEQNEIRYIYDAEKRDKHAMAMVILKVLGKAMLYLFIALTIIAHTIWAVERFNGDEHNFSKNYFKGIAQSYYWAVVVCSTVGFGDIVAKTGFGRFLTCIIIFGGIAWFGGFLGYMTMEIGRIKDCNNFSIEQDFKAIGVPANSTSAELLNAKDVLTIEFKSLDDCYTKMKQGKLDCMVYDRKPLEFLIENDPRFALGNRSLANEFMGIICATPEHKQKIDTRIIKELK